MPAYTFWKKYDCLLKDKESSSQNSMLGNKCEKPSKHDAPENRHWNGSQENDRAYSF